MITVPERYTQTDGQTTCDRNTALCTKVHRAVKTVITNNIITNGLDDFCCYISHNGSCEKDASVCIGKATAVFGETMRKILKNKCRLVA